MPKKNERTLRREDDLMQCAAFLTVIWAILVASCQSQFKTKVVPDDPVSPAEPSVCLALGDLANCEGFEDPIEASPTSPAVFQPPASAGGELFVVAHQDDDLLFMNPDVLHAIQAGKQVRTVYLSSGEAGLGEAYWQSREKGVEAAYAQMAGVENGWETVPYVFDGKSIHLRYLVKDPVVSLMFLRLPDGMVYGDGTAAYGMKTIEKLWKGTISDIPSSDLSQTFSRNDIVDLLLKVMNEMKVERVNSLDSSKEIFSAGDVRSWFTHDNSDHIFSGYFAFEAQRRYTITHRYRFYVGYTVEDHSQNVPTSDFSLKFDTLKAYTPFDSQTCGAACAEGDLFGFWSKRKVSSVAVPGAFQGRIHVYGTHCLQPVGASSADGTAIEIAVCNQNPEQLWQLNGQGRLKGLNGKCLQVSGGSALDGAAVTLATCDGSDFQHWTYVSTAQFRSMNNKCLDVKDGATTAGAAVQILGCNGLAQQRISWRFADPVGRAQGTEFSHADIGGDVNMAASFKMPDINGDGRPDACVVRSDGLHCALMQNDGTFANRVNLLVAMSGGTAGYTSTAVYGDLNADGKDDVCVRVAAGIACAEINSDATAFVNYGLRTSGNDFADADGWNASALLYHSIVLGDVNGDDKADICGRRADGIVCALNNGSGMFNAASLWISSAVAEAGEWGNVAFATSVQLADIDGDGRDDVCFLATKGLYCAFAKANGDGFERYFRASHKDDFVAGWQGSATYYRSIRYPDANGDGILDVCARAMAGIICGIGIGNGYFDKAQAVTLPHDFTDGAGWSNDMYIQSFHYGDINGDGHADVCARGFFGILCSHAP